VEQHRAGDGVIFFEQKRPPDAPFFWKFNDYSRIERINSWPFAVGLATIPPHLTCASF
jgi:hypothetical protein